MSNVRFMRLLVFFDLPTATLDDRRNYRKFRRTLIKNGFIMLQESVYCKMLSTPSVENSVQRLLTNNKPPSGMVQTITITEKQFVNMNYIVGDHYNDVIDNEDRVIIL